MYNLLILDFSFKACIVESFNWKKLISRSVGSELNEVALRIETGETGFAINITRLNCKVWLIFTEMPGFGFSHRGGAKAPEAPKLSAYRVCP
jgi:hypothetical protein